MHGCVIRWLRTYYNCLCWLLPGTYHIDIFHYTTTVAKQIIRQIHLGKWIMYLVNHNARHLLLYWNYQDGVSGHIHARIQRGDRGTGHPPPMKNHKNKGFLSNTGLDRLKNHNATKPAFIVGPSSARQRNAIRWQENDGPLLVVFWFTSPHQPKKMLSELDPIWQNFLDPRMIFHGTHPKSKARWTLTIPKVTHDT